MWTCGPLCCVIFFLFLLGVFQIWDSGAARAGHAFAAFNLGMVYLYGYGVPRPDQEIAGDWFEMSGIPEGLAAVAMHRDATGRSAEAAEWWKRAKVKGYGTAWRKRAREATGSGGATGVDLNLALALDRGTETAAVVGRICTGSIEHEEAETATV